MSKSEKQKRREKVVAQIALAASVLCESHKDRAKQDESLERIRTMCTELLDAGRLNDEKRKRFCWAFSNAAEAADGVVEFEGNSLHVDGWFDLQKLNERMVIIDPKPELKQIGGDNADQ